jgi:lipopolysaccharide transport system ATP-binding protein
VQYFSKIMSDSIIRVENLSKKYILAHQSSNEKYTTLRDSLVRSTQTFFKNLSPRKHQKTSQLSPFSREEFWALNDVSFEVKQGDRVGIIGRNGAGKSTLLKILSRITEPTKGKISIRGRVASLLEVGTGFHPELTGRENIFLNGAILGMSKIEIQRKFDEIVDFAEVAKFLDTPVKRYSSGMYVRLAFAVAAHLEPEILIVDEVLAVGDVEFQNKCLGKMKDVAHSGRTVLFVSHNMAAIRQLCSSAILLQQGRISLFGTADQVVSRYLTTSHDATSFKPKVSRYGIELADITLEEAHTHRPTHAVVFNQDYILKLIFHAHQPLTDTGIVVRIHDDLGTLVSSICTPEEGIPHFSLQDRMQVNLKLDQLQLFPGRYWISVLIYRSNDFTVYLEAEDALMFEVCSAMIHGAACAYRSDHGIVRICSGGQVFQPKESSYVPG